MENVLVKREVSRFYSSESGLELAGNARGNAVGDFSFKDLSKRALDLTLAIMTIVLVMSWLFPLVALLIKLTSDGPVLFKQKRHGLGNKPFYCYKFRTMVQNNEADTKQATVNDDRITSVGKFLRSSSLDELPQIFNVLKGEMSIVGPRPHTIPMNLEFAKSIDGFMVRHSVKPGITGLAQSKGYRGEIKKFEDLNSRYRLDKFYVENWCLLFDIKIILLTVKSLVSGNQKAY